MTVKRLRKAATPQLQGADWFIDRIGEGKYDDNLRAIVRACFYRREALTGESHVIPDPEPDPELLDTKKTHGVATVQPAPEPDDEHKSLSALTGLPLYDSDKMFEEFRRMQVPLRRMVMSPIPKGVHAKDDSFMYAGKRYRKTDIVGKVLEFPNIMNPSALHGVKVGILGVGPSSFKVLIIGQPVSRKGSYYDKWVNHEPFYVSKNTLMALLTQ